MGKNMKIVLDNIIFFMQRAGGGSVYWAENIQRLDKKNFDIEYTEPKGDSENIFYSKLKGKLTHPIKKENFCPKLLSFLPFQRKMNSRYVFHSSYYRVSSSTKAINIVTIHDFMPEMFFGGFKRFYHSYRKKRAILNANGLICISENTHKDLLNYYPQVKNKSIRVIHSGVSDKYFSLGKEDFKLKDLPDKYLLFVGKRSHYKNFSFAIDLVKKLQKYDLVVVGEEFTKNEARDLSRIRGKYILFKNPENEIVNELYNRAFCLLYPSSYEGFGIPVIEAMKSGCPVVGLNASSIPEISNGAAFLVNQLNVDAFAEAIVELEKTEVRADVIKKGFRNSENFNWNFSVDQLVDYYKSFAM
jgi:mannosyltransferase